MSVKIMGMVWDLDNSLIDREEKYVLLSYADHADHKGYNIFPAISTICQKTGYKERAAQIITKSLNGKGYLLSDGKGPKGTNKWRIPLDKEGVRIAPAKNAPPQKDVDWGADGTVHGGALADAPESSEAPEPNDIDIEKELIIKALTLPAATLFPKDLLKWQALEKKIRAAQTAIQGGVLIISGLGIEAAFLEDRYALSFNRQLVVNQIGGFTSLTFQE